MTSLAQLPIQKLIQSAYDLGSPTPFQSTGAPLVELKRLMSIAGDLNMSESGIEKALQKEPKTPISSNLRFEARACGSSAAPSGMERGATRDPYAPLEPSMLDQTFGTELLRTLSSHGLSPDSRIEALRRLAMAMTNPTRQNLESVMMILVTDDPFIDQTQKS